MRIITLISFVLCICSIGTGKVIAQFQYISPVPNSLYHNPETNIILKNGGLIDPASLKTSLIEIDGSMSGNHTCRIVLSEDQKTIVIYPETPFHAGESVNVSVADGFRKSNGEVITGTSFSFAIHEPRTAKQLRDIQKALENCHKEEWGEQQNTDLKEDDVRDPCSIIPYTITSTGNEYDADVWYFNFRANDPLCYAKTIITNTGDSVFAEFDNNRGIGWTINHNGYLTFYNTIDSCFEMMDSTYTSVKKFFMGNGYRADEHEFLVFPDGSSFMFCYDVQPDLDLTGIGGLDSVDVIGLVIQKLDANANVVFEWRSWDHFEILDAAGWYEIFLPIYQEYDYVHGNSMELDFDGNLLLSSRHMCEITKIDLATGNIIWRWGGENNEFSFFNDPSPGSLHFSGQHDFRRLPSGNYTMFNNGNGILPLKSSAKEYELDQTNKEATLVWSYEHPQVNSTNVYGVAMGSVQRLPNNNTFINWGLISQAQPYIPRFTEVDPTGNIVWEFNWDTPHYYMTYRAHKFIWDRCAPPAETSYTINYVSTDSVELSWGDFNYASSYIFEYKLDTATNWITIPLTDNFIALGDLEVDAEYVYRVQSICTAFLDTSAFSPDQEFSTLGTGIVQAVSVPSISLYPNPARHFVTLSIKPMAAQTIYVSVRNMLGHVFLEFDRQVKAGKNTINLDLSLVPKGTYQVEVISKEGSVCKQLILQ